MTKKLKVFIFIENDFVIRNFIKSEAFKDLILKHDVKYILPDPTYKRFRVKFDDDLFTAPIIRVSIPSDRVLMWRWLFLADQLRFTLNPALRTRRSFYAGMLGKKGSFLFKVLSLPLLRSLFKKYVHRRMKINPCDELTDLLDREHPDVLLHPSTFEGCYMSDLIAEGRKRKIPTVLIMNSWDNPSLKRSMAGIPDWITVWGDQTRQHTHQFMDMPLEKIVKLGAAQFDLFRNPPRISRDEFCREHGIDPSKKIVLYAGSSRNTNELSELMALDESIESGHLKDIAIVYRPHPWGNGGVGGDHILNHTWRHIFIENSMRDYLERLSRGDKTPDTADYRRTHDVLSAIDVLISPFSTIILEGALHGKPVMCLLTEETQSITQRKNLLHFDEMFSLEEISIAYESDDLVERILDLVSKSKDPTFVKDLLEKMRYFVEHSSQPYNVALTQFVEKISNFAPITKVTK